MTVCDWTTQLTYSYPTQQCRRSGARIPLIFNTKVCNINHTMSQKQPITDLLRKMINESGVPFLTLEQQTGVLRQSLMRFARGETSIHLDSADEVAKFFGLELRPTAKTRKFIQNSPPHSTKSDQETK